MGDYLDHKEQEAIEESVEKEIAKYKKLHKDRWAPAMLNNMRFHLFDDYSYRDVPRSKREWQRTVKDILSEEGRLSHPPFDNISNRRLNETYEEFYRNFDKVIKECGLQPDELRKLSQLTFGDIYYVEGHELKPEEVAEVKAADIKLAELLVPVYKKLRLMGYSRYDICA